MSFSTLRNRTIAKIANKPLFRLLAEREGLKDTPKRVIEAYREWFAGYDECRAQELSRVFEDVNGYDDIVMLKKIDVESHCEHHIAPIAFKGGADEAMAAAKRDMDFVRPEPTAFLAAAEDSIDRAVMEKTREAVVVPARFGWSDVGSWSALWDLGEKDALGNVSQHLARVGHGKQVVRLVPAEPGPAQVVADVRRLPFGDASFDWVMADPPYAESYAEQLYGTGAVYPRPAHILREAARGATNTMYPLLDCVRAYATIGEMCDALREVWGEYQEQAII